MRQSPDLTSRARLLIAESWLWRMVLADQRTGGRQDCRNAGELPAFFKIKFVKKVSIFHGSVLVA